MSKQILVLIGSPRPKSTSGFLAQYLADGLAARGWQAQVEIACKAVRQPDHWPVLEAAFCEADAVFVVSPVYVDSLPAELTSVLERLVGLRGGRPGRICAVFNCGFAEAVHNDVALNICRLFGRDAGLHWAGGLAIGGGGMLAGKPLTAHGPTAHIAAAFDQTIAAIDDGVDIPASALSGVRQPAIPAWLYFAMANLSFITLAAQRGSLRTINARPYEE
jgi:hypothetical protein